MKRLWRKPTSRKRTYYSIANLAIYVLDDRPVHSMPEVRHTFRKTGYILIIIEEGITGFVQVNETRLRRSLNPFLANVFILYPPKTPENQTFPGVFGGCKMGILATNGLIVNTERQTHRNCHSHMFFRIGVFKNFSNFTEKQLYWCLFLIKLQVWRSATLTKRDSNTGVFLWNQCSKCFHTIHKKYQFLIEIRWLEC